MTKAQAQTPTQTWQLVVNQEVKYFSWEGTRGYPPSVATGRGKGSQIYAPVTMQLSGKWSDLIKFEFVGRGGYVYSKQTTPGATGSVSTTTDTVVAATWTYLGWRGVQPFFSLNANLPSGESDLLRSRTFARMDPDLVELPTFGEGWNYGPTVGVSFFPADNFVVSFGAGHTVRGSYDRESQPVPTTLTRIDPGDTTTVNMSVAFRKGPLTVQTSGSYSHEGKTSLNGTPTFQYGDRYVVSGTSTYAWSDTSVSSMVASWSYSQKNKALAPPFALEGFNSNSHVYRARFEHAFIFGTWSVGPVMGFLYRDENSYSPPAFQFIPAKTLWSAGGNLRHRLNDKTLLYAGVEHLWVEEDSRPVPGVTVPALSYTGWVATVGGTFQF